MNIKNVLLDTNMFSYLIIWSQQIHLVILQLQITHMSLDHSPLDFTLIMQIKTWKLRNKIFSVDHFFITQHCKDNGGSSQCSFSSTTIWRHSSNLHTWMMSQLAQSADHSMSSVRLWNIMPAREIDAWTYLWHQMTGFISD